MAKKKLEDYPIEELYQNRKKLSTVFAVFAGLVLVLMRAFAYLLFSSDKDGPGLLMVSPLVVFAGVFVVLLSQRNAIDQELKRRRER
jgi:hypothetical protein